MIIPWQVDVPQDRYPFANWLIVAGIVAAFVFQTMSIRERKAQLLEVTAQYANRPVEDIVRDFNVDEKRLKEIQKSAEIAVEKLQDALPPNIKPTVVRDTFIKQAIIQEYFVWGKVRPFILNGWHLNGLFGHIWLHEGIIHLLGNLLFLWIFGNAVCAKIGNLKYLFFYLGLGVVAAASHLIFTGGSALGASGAINGIVGMFLVFFPENEITCYFVFFFPLLVRPYAKEFCLSSMWVILLWLAFDIWGATSGGGRVAYFAHLGGFFAGVLLAIVMLKTKIVVMEPRYEKSLLDILAERRKPPEPEPDRLYGNFQRDIEYAKSLEAKTAPAAVAVSVERMPAEERRIQPDEPPPEPFIRFACPCGKKVKIPAKYAGKTGRCPACKKQIRIPRTP